MTSTTKVANSGHFRKGPDKRRHKLTRADRQRGFETTFNLVLAGRYCSAWLAKRVKSTCGGHP